MWEKELQEAINVGRKAKDLVMEIYRHTFEVEIKDDNSPVTTADKKSDEYIRNYLASVFPTHAFLTEESSDNKSRLNNDYVWIIDPVDGTKDFVAKDDEFAINIALSYKHKIVVGVVVVPAYDEIYYASENNGAFYQKSMQKPVKIHVNDKKDNVTVLTSVFHFTEEEQAIIDRHKKQIGSIIAKGSSLKPCLIAKGEAEVTIRTTSHTKEWDTAAPQIVVEEAGGVFLDLLGNEIRYNRDDVYNRNGYIAANRKENLFH